MTTLRMNRGIFFAAVRKSFYPKGMKQTTVDGINALVDEYERRDDLQDDRQFAYVLATAYHETAHTFEPLREYGRGRGRKYGKPINGKVYYGRGFVQLTWDYNYSLMGRILGLPLLAKPDLALDKDIATDIIFEGMYLGVSNRGDFTGKALEDYIEGDKCDYVGARRIVNGTDRAKLIAGYAVKFEAALKLAYAAQEIVEVPQPPLPPKPEIVVVPPPKPVIPELPADAPVVKKDGQYVDAPEQPMSIFEIVLGVVEAIIAIFFKAKV